MTKLRKIFASSVMVMTVVVMSGLTAPMATKAAAQTGDLIKKDGLSAVYYLKDGKRYVFPNEATYKSWYSDFSGVVTISADELASYPLAANVVVRPGTKLVKITTDPKVYAVEANGVLRWVQTEADAKALYGDNWAQRVIDVADSFFINYTIGSPLASGEVPMGSLVKKAGESNIYYYDGSDYRLIEDEVAFKANRFQFDNVLTINNFTPSGSDITGSETDIINVAQNISGDTVRPDQGSGVTVALNSNTPASKAVPQTVGRIPFAKVNLTASSDGITYIDSITVTRTGLTTYAANDFKVWAEKDGVSIASKRALSNNDNVVLNFSPVLTIPAGQTVTLDILGEVTTVTGNGALGIASASDVSASGATVSGSFPITGNLMSFTDYEVTTLAYATSSVALVDAKIGDENVELASFELTSKLLYPSATGRDLIVKSIKFRNNGVEDLSKVVMNMYLENNGEVVSENATFDGRYATFNMKNGGYEVLKEDGGSEMFAIKADIIGKENIATNSIELKLNKSEDIYAYEKATGFGAKVKGEGTSFGATEIKSGAIDVAKKSTNPASKDVIKGTKNEVVLLANIKADEAIKTEGIDIDYTGNQDSFQNIKVYLNNVLLSSFDLAASVPSTETIDSAITLNQGNNELKVTVDVKTTASVSDTFTASLADTLFNAHNPEYSSSGNPVGAGEINGSAQGAIITVAGGAFTVTRNDGYTNYKKIAQGSADVSLGKFAVKATNDAIRINSITLGGAIGDGVGTTTDYAHIYDMKLFVDGSQIGTTRNFTSSGSTFSSLNYSISQNTTKVIELRGSLTSDAAQGATTTFLTVMTVNAQDSLGKTIDPKTASTTRFEVTSSGKLVVTAKEKPGANILIAKTGVEQEVAQYTFTSEDDSSNITEIVITNASSTSPRISSYKLYLGSTLLNTAVPEKATTTFHITNDQLVVNSGESKTVTLKAVFNTIEDKEDTGKILQAKIHSVKAKSSTGAELADSSIDLTSVSSQEMVIRRTKPTFAYVSSGSGRTPNAHLLTFSITADANNDLKIISLVFDSWNTTTTDFKLYDHDTNSFIAQGDNTTFTGLTLVVEAGDTRTFRVYGNTSALTKDDPNGLTLNNNNPSNIKWQEKFGSNYTTDIDGTNLGSFPIERQED